jgi:hypothetical protein
VKCLAHEIGADVVDREAACITHANLDRRHGIPYSGGIISALQRGIRDRCGVQRRGVLRWSLRPIGRERGKVRFACVASDRPRLNIIYSLPPPTARQPALCEAPRLGGLENTTMTTEQKIIRSKVGLLELAKQLGNVMRSRSSIRPDRR